MDNPKSEHLQTILKKKPRRGALSLRRLKQSRMVNLDGKEKCGHPEGRKDLTSLGFCICEGVPDGLQKLRRKILNNQRPEDDGGGKDKDCKVRMGDIEAHHRALKQCLGQKGLR